MAIERDPFISDHIRRQKRRERQREYENRPEVKERIRARKRKYEQRPDVKAKKRAYYHRPEIQKRLKEYYNRPDVRERTRASQRKYQSRPEIKKKKAEQHRKWQARKKVEIRAEVVAKVKDAILDTYIRQLGCEPCEVLERNLYKRFPELRGCRDELGFNLIDKMQKSEGEGREP